MSTGPWSPARALSADDRHTRSRRCSPPLSGVADRVVEEPVHWSVRSVFVASSRIFTSTKPGACGGVTIAARVGSLASNTGRRQLRRRTRGAGRKPASVDARARPADVGPCGRRGPDRERIAERSVHPDESRVSKSRSGGGDASRS